MTVRRRILVAGIVQGVGFRPAVARAAASLGLSGEVRNTRQGASIEAEGEEGAVSALVLGLASYLPPNARLEGVEVEELEPRFDSGFSIARSSAGGQSRFSISPDLAMCPACRRELLDPSNRRYRHPFIGCGDCGPRYSYILDLPYDRANTTMSAFPMCPSCRAEYEDSADRRFHIEGFCCPDCGPVLKGYEEGLAALRGGGIVAVKGIGGYHIACLAEDEGAVAELRRRKARPTKPLAVMYPGIEALEAGAELLEAEREALSSSEVPIVLLPKARFRRPPLELLAPGNPALGVMLPYAPLQLILLGDLGRPLVMTSANMAGDPLIIDDEAARRGLASVVDAFIWHGRRIARRADDGVVFYQGPGMTRVRNGRGAVPRPFRLASPARRQVLALGGELKSTVCVASGHDLVASPHIGDLENEPTFEGFRRAADEMLAFYGVEPELVACDLHPDYESTRYAIEFAERRSLPLVRVQHHFAHLLSALLDLGRLGGEGGSTGPFLGIILDGTGYGSDGTIWGGELLLGGMGGFERLSSLAPLALPGGEAAIREPWRILAPLGLRPIGLWDQGAEPSAAREAEMDAVRRVAADPVLSPRSSSCGRLFDAAAALLGFDWKVSFEGEAAIWLEALASEAAEREASAGEASARRRGLSIDFAFPAMDGSALLAAMAEELRQAGGHNFLARLALGFHRSLARNIAAEASRLAEERGLGEAFLSGGVFQNRLFTAELVSALAEAGLEARLPLRVPPNDACLSIGQAVFAIGPGADIL
jgi:hydrogenase maturation protein HypF